MKDHTLGFGERILRFIFWLMPERCCNMIFMVSLVKHLQGQDDLDTRVLTNLSETLGFVYNEDTARFPMLISKVIWRWSDAQQSQLNEVLAPQRELDAQQIEALLTVAQQGNRNWHLYSDERQLRADVTRVLEDRGVIFA